MSYSLRDADLADAKRELQRMIAAGQVTVETPLFKPGTVIRRMFRSEGSKKQQPAQSPIAANPTPSPAAPSSPARNPTLALTRPQVGGGNSPTRPAPVPMRHEHLSPEAALTRWLTIHHLFTGGMKRKAIAAKMGIPLKHVIYNLKKKMP